MQRRHIHVAARIRPFLGNDPEEETGRVVKAISDATVRVSGGSDFVFDSAFGDDKNQVDVFNLVAKDIVKGCIEGYNGTVFAYGQTGSGKTYTMVGPGSLADTLKSCPERGGLIPRAAELMFILLNEKQEKTKAFTFEVKATFVQLYKEKLYDLLQSGRASGNLQIHLDNHGNTVLTGAEERVINTISDLVLVVDEGLARRKVAETAMNAESSRSHAILTLTVKTTVSNNDGIIINKCSRLNLVDLAGSERQKDALSTGERLKEASSINLSLLMLGRVIRALSEPDFKPSSYVAYRDSTLTLLLKDSLGGNAQTAVIVTVHPNKRFMDETILTLKFAQHVKKVKNHVVVNEDLTGENVDAFKAEIHRLNVELAEAKRLYQQLKVEAEEKYKVERDRFNEQLQKEYAKELDEKDRELRQLKVRYARCIDSFELLRRYQEAPENVFIAIDEYMKRGDEQLEDMKKNWASLSMKDIEKRQINTGLEGQDVQKDNGPCSETEPERNDEIIADEMSKAACNAIRRRLSIDSVGDSENSPLLAKTSAQLKRERRMTRFTVRNSSYNRDGHRAVPKPILENENDFEDPFDEVKEVDDAYWEKEKLKWECENNRLMQINGEFEGQLLELSKKKNELLVRNDQLEKNVKDLEEKLSTVLEEKRKTESRKDKELDSLRQMCKNLQSEMEEHWHQLCSLNAEKTDLTRKIDDLKEINEGLEGDKAVFKLNAADKENENVHLTRKLQDLQNKWDGLQKEIISSVIDILTPQINSVGNCKRRRSSFVDGLEAINQVREVMRSKNDEIATMKEKLKSLEEELNSARRDRDDAAGCVDDLMHDSENYRSKVQYIKTLRQQLSDARARVNQLEKEVIRGKISEPEENRKQMLTRSKAARLKAKKAFDDNLSM